MIRHIRTVFASLLVGSVLVGVMAPAVGALDLWDQCNSNSDTAVCKGKGDKVDNTVKNITSLLLWALGAVAVIMLVIGGFKYVTSNGDSNNIQQAKNTVLYAVIGLVVAILGQIIVTYVVSWL